MKKILLIKILMASNLVLWTGCNQDNLELKPTIPFEEEYYQTEAQMDGGVIGIYSKLVFFYNYRGYEGANYLHDVRLLPDDDLTTYNTNSYEVFSLITPQDTKVRDYFKYLYELNARANSMLDIHSKKADEVYKNEDLKNNHRGEMLFLRGFSHYMLWNLYGVAPVILERTQTEAQLYPSNSSGVQLLDAAIQDFKAAAPLLPDAWSDVNKGRVTKSAALGMAGKTLIFRGTVNNAPADFTEAKSLLDQISGPGLMSNYYDNFSKDTENNTESLFEIQLGLNTNSEGSNPWLNTDRFAGNGDLSGYYGFFDGHWSNNGTRMIATQSLKDAFDPGDGRLESTFEPNGNVIKYVKGSTKGDQANFEVAYHRNARILRYAEVLLLKAEALVQSNGSLPEAIGYINEVRERANPGDPSFLRDQSESDRNKVMQWIIDERRFELAFEEGIRWFDLRRWHMGGVLQQLYGKDLLNWDFSSVHKPLAESGPFEFQERNLYYPIPLSEVQLNPNLVQNALWIGE